jgi:ubiquinone biosynthesis protein
MPCAARGQLTERHAGPAGACSKRAREIMLFRCFYVFGVFAWNTVLCVFTHLGDRLRRHSTAKTLIGRYLCKVLQESGGAFPKVGQILSTRPDLLPADICAELARLQDRIPPLKPAIVEKLLSHEYPVSPFRLIAAEPDAAATIAQVHRAECATEGREVALKIMRPGVRRRIEQDCNAARTLSPAMCLTRAMRSVPIREAIQEVGLVLQRQTDFRLEAANLRRLRQDFRNYPGVVVPELVPEHSTGQILCLEYIGGLKKLTDPSIPAAEARELIKVGLRVLYRMIFETGFLHCDLHPGNVMASGDGRLAILDAGLMTELSDSTRRSFAEFFACIALRKGKRAAEIIRLTATRLPADLDRTCFDEDIGSLIVRSGGLDAEHFDVASFVGELFAIQSKHRIRGTSQFSLIILALLVYEGLAKQRYPDLDFQREAIPFVVTSVLTSEAKIDAAAS